MSSCAKKNNTGAAASKIVLNTDYDKAWKYIDKGDDKNGFYYLDKAKDAYIKSRRQFFSREMFCEYGHYSGKGERQYGKYRNKH